MQRIYTSGKAFVLLLGFALLSTVFLSCKEKEDDNGGAEQYAITFKANGSLVELKLQGSLVAAFAQAGTVFNGVFTGSDGVSSVSLQVYDNKTISETTYSEYQIVGTSVIGSLINYNMADGTGYSQGSVNPNVTIMVTEITDTTVRGNFNATVKATGKPDISITDGEFFIWRAN